MTKSDILRVFLRIVGAAELLAVFAVVMPYSRMNAIHQWLGLGVLPDEPIVGYLARSTSAFYAILGGLCWVVSFDLSRHRTIVRYLGGVTLALGITLLTVDLVEGLPRYWVLGEGPISILMGILVLVLVRGVKEPS